ncbi:two-component regulator propeller domain-containing protein [uncultured Polaribacter sp.]|uniref:hybrid sensor histidine kinase/response regulator transcription factor n=1 Tax=uncultured Polaribacter sp. TaxID=174711 RepID=UPI0026325888|nr:two-component regulator propeller domain-containing protein [uncultured Polaribacter sp.]
MTKKILFFINLLFFLCFHTIAQQNELSYSKKITISQGLAHNGVTCILKDSKGFIWIGTYEGINKYDGYKLTTYKNTLDSELLSSNRVRALTEDTKQNLWIGTDEGITIYNTSSEKFTQIYPKESISKEKKGVIVRKILVKKNKIYCLTEGRGILLFDQNYKLLNQFVPVTEKQGDLIFFDAKELYDENILFSTSQGLLFFDNKKNSFRNVLESEIDFSSSILAVNDSIFITTISKGAVFFSLNKKKKTFQTIKHVLKDYQFNSSLIDAKGNLWLGTLNKGIIQIENIHQKIALNNVKPFARKVFTDDLDRLRISTLFSSSISIWVGSFNEGLYQFDIKENPFKKYNKENNDKYGLVSYNITGISALDESRVFVTAAKGGIGLFNTRKNVFEPLPFDIPSEYKLNVSNVFVDSRKAIWLKIGKLGLYRVKQGSKSLIKINNQILNENLAVFYRTFSEDRYGNIWIGSDSEVIKISINNFNEIKNVELLNKNNFFKKDKISLIRVVYPDPIKNVVWIGTDSDGLFKVENNEETKLNEALVKKITTNTENKKSLTSNFITSILRLPNNELWIGTENGGVCKVVEKKDSFEFISFSEKNGLSNNVVKSIQYDTNNSLWISTNIGLNNFDLKTNVFRKFNLSDGLPFEDFWYPSEKLGNGIFLFSGLDGFCYFNSNKISAKEKLPIVLLENFKLFNNKVYPSDTIHNRILFDKDFSELSQLNLKYNENVFSLDIVSLHFSNPKNHLIRYKLYPINENWVTLPSNRNTINYSGLQPGEYELSYKASNSLNEWTPTKKIKINITPPFWKTNWAYFIYFLSVIILLYLVIKIITKIQSLNHKVAIEKLEINSVKELNESKLRFFSNISHEIKTPLTLISSPLGVLLNRYKNNLDVSEKLVLIKRQTKKIRQLVNQANDFRRAEANLLKMNYSRFNFNDFIQEVTDDFMFLASKDEKNFELIAKNKNIIVSADKDKLEKIINNLINNAFKYTRANDIIKIEFSCNEKDLDITVSDTGIGIDEEDLKHVFERFYQSKTMQQEHISGSGIGLAFSKKLVEMHYGYINAKSTLNEGTSIQIQLPIVKQQTGGDEILEKKKIELPEEKEILLDKQALKKEELDFVEVNKEFSEALIFYAEDNLEMRLYVSDILSKYFNVKVFRNGQECLDALEDNWPDLIISDVQMPILDGLDLCIAIKSDLKTSHIPVILLTALTNIEDHIKGLRDGADAYIKKPFSVKRLIANVEALLDNRKKLRERYQVGIPLTKENNKNNRNDNAFLEKLYSIMEDNLDNQNFDINTLAKELYLNRTHFYQKVKVLTNKTPFELIKIYRLQRAAKFLSQDKLSVNEVFLMTGFKSRTHFTKIFKEKYNVSPSKYANEVEKKFES